MKNPDAHNPNPMPPTTGTESKRPFAEPEISDPVDVVNGNPAATSLFAVAGSGVAP